MSSELPKNNINVSWLWRFQRQQCRATTCNSVPVLSNPFYSMGIERQKTRVNCCMKFSVPREPHSYISQLGWTAKDCVLGTYWECLTRTPFFPLSWWPIFKIPFTKILNYQQMIENFRQLWTWSLISSFKEVHFCLGDLLPLWCFTVLLCWHHLTTLCFIENNFHFPFKNEHLKLQLSKTVEVVACRTETSLWLLLNCSRDD